MIEITEVTKTFRLSKKQMRIDNTKDPLKVAVDNISFQAFPGEIFGLLGPNGAGKTTTLRCIATLIKPDKGTIEICGIPSTKEVDVKLKMAFLTNELHLEEQFTPNYLFRYFASLYNLNEEQIIKRQAELFERFGVSKFSEVKIGELSTGMKQKISIVISLINDPEVIVFDEPTNGLDVLTAKTITDYLLEQKEKGKTIIISTHIMDLVQKLCDRVGIIINGKLVLCDKIANIIDDQNHDLEEIFFNLYKEEMEKAI